MTETKSSLTKLPESGRGFAEVSQIGAGIVYPVEVVQVNHVRETGGPSSDYQTAARAMEKLLAANMSPELVANALGHIGYEVMRANIEASFRQRLGERLMGELGRSEQAVVAYAIEQRPSRQLPQPERDLAIASTNQAVVERGDSLPESKIIKMVIVQKEEPPKTSLPPR